MIDSSNPPVIGTMIQTVSYRFAIEISKSRSKYKVLKMFSNKEDAVAFIIKYQQENTGKAWKIRLRDNAEDIESQVIMIAKFDLDDGVNNG